MFADAPPITSQLDALDEIDDIQHSLQGLSQIIHALKIADLAEHESLDLIARLLDYLSQSLSAAQTQLEESDGQDKSVRLSRKHRKSDDRR